VTEHARTFSKLDKDLMAESIKERERESEDVEHVLAPCRAWLAAALRQELRFCIHMIVADSIAQESHLCIDSLTSYMLMSRTWWFDVFTRTALTTTRGLHNGSTRTSESAPSAKQSDALHLDDLDWGKAPKGLVKRTSLERSLDHT